VMKGLLAAMYDGKSGRSRGIRNGPIVSAWEVRYFFARALTPQNPRLAAIRAQAEAES